MGYRDYLNSNEWKETKDFLSFIKEKKCWVCDSSIFLNVHHLHYKAINYEDADDIIYLCKEHHKKIHFQEEGKKRKFETNRDFALACRKLQSMRSKLGKKIDKNDIVSIIATKFY